MLGDGKNWFLPKRLEIFKKNPYKEKTKDKLSFFFKKKKKYINILKIFYSKLKNSLPHSFPQSY